MQGWGVGVDQGALYASVAAMVRCREGVPDRKPNPLHFLEASHPGINPLAKWNSACLRSKRSWVQPPEGLEIKALLLLFSTVTGATAASGSSQVIKQQPSSTSSLRAHEDCHWQWMGAVHCLTTSTGRASFKLPLASCEDYSLVVTSTHDLHMSLRLSLTTCESLQSLAAVSFQLIVAPCPALAA